MHHFAYRDGVLHAEDVDLRALADEVGTPFYCYSTATLERHYRVFAEAFAGARRARLLRHEGELQPGRAARRSPGSAPAWTSSRRASCAARSRPACRASDRLLRRRQDARARWRPALDAGILCFNVESEPELEALVRGRGRQRAGARRSRSASTRTSTPGPTRKISTGKSENKFGIPIARAREVYARAAAAAGHQGHRRRHAYRQPDHRARAVRRRLRSCWPSSPATCGATGTRSITSTSAAGSASPIARTIAPPPDPQAYAAIIKRHTQDLGLKLIFETGRMIAGNAGILVTRVVYVKDGRGQDLRHRRRRR